MFTPGKILLTTLWLLFCLSAIPACLASASAEGAGCGLNIGASCFNGLGANFEVMMSKNSSVFAGAGFFGVYKGDSYGGWSVGAKVYSDSLTKDSWYLGLGYGLLYQEQKTIYGLTAIIGDRWYFHKHYNLSVGIGGSYAMQEPVDKPRFFPTLEITIGWML